MVAEEEDRHFSSAFEKRHRNVSKSGAMQGARSYKVMKEQYSTELLKRI